jgi:hypothetical protein
VFAFLTGSLFGSPKERVFVDFLKWIGALRRTLSMERLVTLACAVCDTIVLHDQSVHVSIVGICLIVLDAKKNLN